MNRLRSVVVAILGLCLALSPAVAWALGGEELVDILREEKVITVDQAVKIKKKVAKVEKKEHLNWKAYWKNGLIIETKDGKTEIKIGGRIQVDFGGLASNKRSFVDQLQASNNRNNLLTGFGAEFRRARLFIEGTVYDIFQFKAQYDFAGGEAAFKDVWLGLTNVPYVKHIRVGQQKEPFSLEELTSSKYITFMERALPNVFAPSRNTGVLLFNNGFKSKRLWWGAGVFVNANDFGDSYQNFQNWDLTARITGLPLYEQKGRKLLHLGLSYSHQFRNADQFSLRYRQRPEFHITDVRPLDTESGSTPGINAGSVDLLNPELALVWGPFSLQGEYMWSFVNAQRETTYTNGVLTGGRNLFLRKNNPTFQGGYIFASFFLTGENRPYSIGNACFGRVKPKHNFDLAGGTGAWEVAFRYSYLNFNSGVGSDPAAVAAGLTPQVGVRGGIENNITVGLNWYPTPNTRWMFNYVYADVNNLRLNPVLPNYNTNYNHGPLQIFQTRFQIDF